MPVGVEYAFCSAVHTLIDLVAQSDTVGSCIDGSAKSFILENALAVEAEIYKIVKRHFYHIGADFDVFTVAQIVKKVGKIARLKEIKLTLVGTDGDKIDFFSCHFLFACGVLVG